jgi:hypothetical protein
VPGGSGGEGKVGPAGLSALSPLPAGDSESGDYGIDADNTSSGIGYLDITVSFPIPLAAGIPVSNVVYTTTNSATHCSGPGHAEPGFLCIYSSERFEVETPPEVIEAEGPKEDGAGRFGFDLNWHVEGEGAYDLGTYTVTAP